MRPALLPIIMLVATACRPAPTDPWPATRRACGFEESETIAWGALNLPSSGLTRDPAVRHHVRLDPECIDAMLADVDTDADALEALFALEVPLADHLEAVRTRALPADGPALLVYGLHWLLSGDFGALDTVAPDPWVSEAFVDALRRHEMESGQSAGRALYDMVATDVRGVVGVAERIQIYVRSGRLSLPDSTWEGDPGGDLLYNSAFLLVHEAQHVESTSGHVSCNDGTVPDGCDLDIEGAHGAGVSAATLNLRAFPFASIDGCAGPEGSEELLWSKQRDQLMVARFNVWDAGILAPRPVQEFAYCDD